jgi:hypothetical protein
VLTPVKSTVNDSIKLATCALVALVVSGVLLSDELLDEEPLSEEPLADEELEELEEALGAQAAKERTVATESPAANNANHFFFINIYLA